jgi:hypothetical protein
MYLDHNVKIPAQADTYYICANVSYALGLKGPKT